jgi:hypothetical protein
MSTLAEDRPADTAEIRSYDDLVAAHLLYTRETATDQGDNSVAGEAAEKVRRLATLYRMPETLTNDMRTTAETALTAINKAAQKNHSQDPERGFAIADTWLDHLTILVNRPEDGR